MPSVSRRSVLIMTAATAAGPAASGVSIAGPLVPATPGAFDFPSVVEHGVRLGLPAPKVLELLTGEMAELAGDMAVYKAHMAGQRVDDQDDQDDQADEVVASATAVIADEPWSPEDDAVAAVAETPKDRRHDDFHRHLVLTTKVHHERLRAAGMPTAGVMEAILRDWDAFRATV